MAKSNISNKCQSRVRGDLQQKLTKYNVNSDCNSPGLLSNTENIKPEDIQGKETLSSSNTTIPETPSHLNKIMIDGKTTKTYHPRKYESIKLNSKAQCVSFSLDKILFHPIPSSKDKNEIFT